MGLKSFLFGSGPKTTQYNIPGADKTADIANYAILERLGISPEKGKNFGFSTRTSQSDLDRAASPSTNLQGRIDRAYDPNQFNATYKPQLAEKFKYNLSGLPKEYGDIEYERGAKNLRRDFDSNLRKTFESTGGRRPGLLSKLSRISNRDLGESLGGLRTGIAQDVTRLNTDLSAREQELQGNENYRQQQFGADEASKAYDSLTSLENRRAGSAQSGAAATGENIKLAELLKQGRRDIDDKELDRLIDLFLKSQQIQGSSRQTIGGGGGLLGGAVNSFAQGLGSSLGGG